MKERTKRMVRMMAAAAVWCAAAAGAFALGNTETITAPGIVGNGPTVTEERSVGAYSAIEIRGAGKVQIVKGARPNVTVHADQSLMPILETKVVDNTLIIEPKNGVNVLRFRRLEVVCYVDAIEKVSIVGSGLVTGGDGITGQNVQYTIEGSGHIDLPKLTADGVTAKIAGSGTIDLRANRILFASIEGSGLVRYRGTPEVRPQIAGSGKIKRALL